MANFKRDMRRLGAGTILILIVPFRFNLKILALVFLRKLES